MQPMIPTPRGNYIPAGKPEPDTGWQVLATTSAVASGTVLIRRRGDRVYISTNDLVLAAGSGSVTVAVYTTGFRPKSGKALIGTTVASVGTQERFANRASDARLWWTGSGTGATTTARPVDALTMDESFMTDDPFPA